MFDVNSLLSEKEQLDKHINKHIAEQIELHNQKNESIDTSNLITSFINRLERIILVHSYIYEEKNNNIISDSDWDFFAKELVRMFERYPSEATQSVYYDGFKGWTGDSASDLRWIYANDAFIVNTAERLLNG